MTKKVEKWRELYKTLQKSNRGTSMNDIKVFACNSAEEFTKEICDNLGIEMGQKDSFKFANDNNFVQLKETVREKDVYIVQTTQPPVNERIMELLITVEAAKRAGARRITAVLPYFMYSRSDKKINQECQ